MSLIIAFSRPTNGFKSAKGQIGYPVTLFSTTTPRQKTKLLWEQPTTKIRAVFILCLALQHCGIVLSLNGHASTWPWLVGIFVVIAMRFALLRRFRSHDRDTLVPSLWFRRYGIGISITGSLWGFIGAYSIQTESPALPFFAIATLSIN